MNALENHHKLANFLAEQFAHLPEVGAVGISGSVMSGQGSETSDIDLYVFSPTPPTVEVRKRIARLRGFNQANFNLQYWDTGDEWFDASTSIEVDVMYWDFNWLENQVIKVINQHQASMGYSTCFWHTTKQMGILFDRNGHLEKLKEKTQVDYPEELRQNIIEKNYPLLFEVIPSYTHQLEKAISRNDLVSVNHRLSEYLASYFDILFALNRILHPGEKRLLSFALNHCQHLPENMENDLTELLTNKQPDSDWLHRLYKVNQAIDRLIREYG